MKEKVRRRERGKKEGLNKRRMEREGDNTVRKKERREGEWRQTWQGEGREWKKQVMEGVTE